MARPKLVKRIRRRMWGGKWECRIYDNNTVRIKVDHPSNDPEVEMAMAGASIRLARETFASYGLGIKVGPVQWRDDPEPNR